VGKKIQKTGSTPGNLQKETGNGSDGIKASGNS